MALALWQTWTPGAHLRGLDGSPSDRATDDSSGGDGIEDASVVDNAVLETPIEVTLSNSDDPLVIMDGHLFRLGRHRFVNVASYFISDLFHGHLSRHSWILRRGFLC